MATISIIILLALLFYLFYFSERMKRIREIVARPIIGLTGDFGAKAPRKPMIISE